jgi:acyl carrier protein
MSLHDQLQELFRSALNNDQIELSDKMTAGDVPGWDSVAHINIMVNIEQTFGVQFTGNQLAEFKNVGELKKFLAANSNS